MDFQTFLVVAFVISTIVSGLDKWVWSKQRRDQMNAAKQKKRNLDFDTAEKILAKPSWVEFSDSMFVLTCVAAIVWLMLPNFELILVVALGISFVITLVEKLYLEKKKKQQVHELYQRHSHPDEKEVQSISKMPWWIDYGWSFFPLLLIIVSLRSFFYEPFKIPSGSMKPTLWVHDFILVNKFAYGLRLPVTKTKLTDGAKPKRGDVVVFRAPHEPEKDYIKRLIALPGDTVYYTPSQQVFIKPNCRTEQAIAAAKKANLTCGVKNKIRQTLVSARGFEGADVYQENLAGVSHDILIEPEAKGVDRYSAQFVSRYNDAVRAGEKVNKRQLFASVGAYYEDWKKGVVVPENSFFVMGDNRNHSSDARFWGFVPESMMVGKAEAIWLHLEFGFEEKGGILSYIPTGVNFDRVGAIK
ncbi:signal peptidase I [Pleionea mediterranea]|uniref:Signal peptidase I n=2 Tax=Pleionea mediterranea TaxID=523701 RepID=A0A316G1B8_9GAMM|nr:signal peptidase I [Pleionea mediterranea]PWK54472.1 signal peptidase I [Pleionea mediterranea]